MDFVRLTDALSPYPELESASFSHGLLCGLMCAANVIDETVWIKKLIEEASIKSMKDSFLNIMHEMYLEVDSGLNGSGFELALCLPTDDEPLSFRAAMVSHWAEGYLYGIGLVGKQEKELERDVSEFFNDLGHISRMSTEELGKDEASENDLSELVEYIRMGVLMANESMNPSESAPIEEENSPTDILDD